MTAENHEKGLNAGFLIWCFLVLNFFAFGGAAVMVATGSKVWFVVGILYAIIIPVLLVITRIAVIRGPGYIVAIVLAPAVIAFCSTGHWWVGICLFAIAIIAAAVMVNH